MSEVWDVSRRFPRARVWIAPANRHWDGYAYFTGRSGYVGTDDAATAVYEYKGFRQFYWYTLDGVLTLEACM